MSNKAIVIEVNEVPLRILRHYQKLKPNSHIGHLFEKSLILETKAEDVDRSDLYPSQTWGSLNTGVEYDLHKIHWYNDPKPDNYPLYWKTIAENNLSVGLVATLHSSPADSYIDDSNYKFVIPDCFASNNLTKPEIYQDFQALNTSATKENGRVSSVKFPKQEAVATLVKSPALGIKFQTVLNSAGLVAQIKTGKVNKERLRNVQFNLLADVFLKQLQAKDVDLAIFFTNHIAANMHRYWYGLFPEDYSLKLYDREWMDKYSSEIMVSVELLDIFLGKIINYCQQQQRVLILVSSMGQAANQKLKKTPKHTYKLKNIRKFLDRVCGDHKYNYEIDAAMIPQYSLKFDSPEEAQECFATIEQAKEHFKNIHMKMYYNDRVITLATGLNKEADEFFIGDRGFNHQELGFRKLIVEDHHSGKHCPEGSLVVYNSTTSHTTNETVNYLEYAPAILEFFGIDKPSYMRTPQFTI
ncbi:hypothetical protein I4641_01180 [Waterburya agarophytonicola K14]|uniref:Uncharacterized protein n=1 Tax=Waterburya agarophytonicola KI4 TaxID=2874699 RepID=A0A964BLH5_9CYAN|nr:hypothetical protein [Waterburya agarophytonicola]MCC0175593.1 hypothetical protein [Waterburya agarophytonicola KI4]